MDAPNYNQSADPPPTGHHPDGLLKAFVEKIKQEVGDDQPDLIKQCVADLNAQDRQNARNHFEARQEYVRQIFELRSISLSGLREYGLQTLKWLFLLNAGAIAAVLAYVSGAAGKSVSPVPIIALAPVLKALWPFVTGCACVVLAGAFGFFNFSYGEASLPATEDLHQFFDPNSKSWPKSRMGFPAWKINGTRTAAIVLAVASTFFFAYGVYRVLHAALKQLG